MKSFGKPLIDFLLSDRAGSFYAADLFEIETAFGMKLYATDGQVPIAYKGNMYDPVKYGIWRRKAVTTKLGMTSSSMTFDVVADGTPMQGNVALWPTGTTRSNIIQFSSDPSFYPGVQYPGGVLGTEYLYGRCSGVIIPTKTGSYTFSILNDDTAQVFINGRLVATSPENEYHQSPNPSVFNYDMVAGTIYNIVVTVNNDGLIVSGVALSWSYPGGTLSLVPAAPGTYFTFKIWKMAGPSSAPGAEFIYPLDGGAMLVANDFDIPLMQAIQQGLFDGAKITVYTAYMPDYGDLVYGVETKYSGQITELNKTGRTNAEGTAESYLFKLNQQMPRMLMQPACRWVFGDVGCTIDTSNFTQTGIVSSSSTDLQIIPRSSFSQPEGYFTQGVITMTSGRNMGLSMSVKQYKGGVIVMTRPFLFSVAAGDTFQVVAGCDHTYATCQQKFNNLINFGGMPWIPNYERSI